MQKDPQCTRRSYNSFCFADISKPRQYSVTGKLLPSPRLISNKLHRTGVSGMLEPIHSAMLMQWGQLLDHDILDTPTMKGTIITLYMYMYFSFCVAHRFWHETLTDSFFVVCLINYLYLSFSHHVLALLFTTLQGVHAFHWTHERCLLNSRPMTAFEHYFRKINHIMFVISVDRDLPARFSYRIQANGFCQNHLDIFFD